MRTHYYEGKAIPAGLYVYRPPHVLLVDDDGERCAHSILYPRLGPRSEWPGNSASLARHRIRRALGIEENVVPLVD